MRASSKIFSLPYCLVAVLSFGHLKLALAQANTLGGNSPSPFEPPTPHRPKGPVIKPTAPAKPRVPIKTNLELRGIMQWRDSWYFSIYDKVDRESHWITQTTGVEEKQIEVKDWDEFTSKLKLAVYGQSIELKLKERSDRPVKIAGAVSPAAKKPKPPIPKPTPRPIVRPSTPPKTR